MPFKARHLAIPCCRLVKQSQPQTRPTFSLLPFLPTRQAPISISRPTLGKGSSPARIEISTGRGSRQVGVEERQGEARNDFADRVSTTKGQVADDVRANKGCRITASDYQMSPSSEPNSHLALC
eukprot:TRINITY_DN1480_c0_g1_i1.p1 TRINITY_DN1480_c0_g1~~TRINITY_DN1480_c0_g1_i1.p1  ORF type:complete len:124 (+),score=12.35 TRINITY_DN1480_c0_g1_i1:488-859(+)